MENDGSNLVLQASTALDCEVFSGGTGDYSSSDLRNYLNTTFLNMAFSGDEQKGLLNADENGDKVTVLSKKKSKISPGRQKQGDVRNGFFGSKRQLCL